jgi:HSP20 family protein
MTLTRWSPVHNLATLEIERLNRMFEDVFGGEDIATGAWTPPVDIYETADKDIVVKVDLPEMKREDIKVTFENNVLSIEGQRTFEEKTSREDYHRVERGYGAFRRSFTLPATIDGSSVNATYQDGVLTVTLPRREETRPRQIQVQADKK